MVTISEILKAIGEKLEEISRKKKFGTDRWTDMDTDSCSGDRKPQ